MTQESLVAGRYRILRVLGRGGFSDVCLAEDLRLGGRKVAIKRIAYHLLHDEERLLKFQQEAEIIGRLTSPNTVRAFDFGQDDNGRYFIVMEYTEGKTLHKALMEEGPFSVERALKIGLQMLDALEEAHAQGIIHRDLKPKNIILTPHRQGDLVKLLDFGVARILKPDEDNEDWTLVGTASYMAPEQAQGKPISPASDLYSVGVLLYHALTGKPPFISQEDPVAVMIHHATSPVKPMREARPDLDLPAALDDIILRALQKNPADRYTSAAEFREALEAVLDTLEEEATTFDTHLPSLVHQAAQEAERDPSLSSKVSDTPPHNNSEEPPQPTAVSGTLHAHLPPPPMVGTSTIRPSPTHRHPADGSGALPVEEELSTEQSPQEDPETTNYDGILAIQDGESITPNASTQGSPYSDSPRAARAHGFKPEEDDDENLITSHSLHAFSDEDEPTTTEPSALDLTLDQRPPKEDALPPLSEEDLDTASNHPKRIDDAQLLEDLKALKATSSTLEDSLQSSTFPVHDQAEDRDTNNLSEAPEIPSTLDLKPSTPPNNRPTHPEPADFTPLKPPTSPVDTSADDWEHQETAQTSLNWPEDWEASTQEDNAASDEDSTLSLRASKPSQNALPATTYDPSTSFPNSPNLSPFEPALVPKEHTLESTETAKPSPFYAPPSTPLPTPAPRPSYPPNYSEPFQLGPAPPSQNTPSFQDIHTTTPTPIPALSPAQADSYTSNQGSSSDPQQPLVSWGTLPPAFLEPPSTASNPTDFDPPEQDLDSLDFEHFQQMQRWRWIGVLGGFAFLLGLFVLLVLAGKNEENRQRQRLLDAYKEALKEGDQAIRISRYHKAYASYRQALKLRPNDPIASRRLHLTQLDLEADAAIKRAQALQRQGQLLRAYTLLQQIDPKASLWDTKGKPLSQKLQQQISQRLSQQILYLKRRRRWKQAASHCTLLPRFSPQHPLLRRTCPYIQRRARRR